MVEAIVDRWGRWDILVSNAAIATTRPLVEFDEPSIDRLVAVNVKGVVWGMQLAAELLADGGRVIAIGSSTTGLVLPGYSVYDATKAAVEQLVRIGAHELGVREITANVVAPGATATETYAAGRGDELVSKFAAMSAFGRLGTPDEIADAVAFLAGDSAGWITGQVIRVNGGNRLSEWPRGAIADRSAARRTEPEARLRVASVDRTGRRHRPGRRPC